MNNTTKISLTIELEGSTLVRKYEYMTSNECPFWAKPKVWAIMSETQRLEAHLQRTCEHVGGKSFTYEVLGD